MELSAAVSRGDGWQRSAIYLRATSNLDLAGLAFSLGVDSGELRFVHAEQAPTLADTAAAGKLALAWLDGVRATSGERVLLGYVETSAGANALKFHGASADAVDERPVILGLGSAARRSE